MTAVLQALILGLLLGGIYALSAAGLAMIFGVMRVINMAHGAFLVLSSFITYYLWSGFGLDPLWAIIFITPVMFGLGYVLYFTLIAPVRKAPVATTVLLTFGVALVIEGFIGLVWGNNSTAIRPSYADESFRFAGLFFPKTYVFGGLIGLGMLAALGALLNNTWTGRAIRAAANNPDGAELVGIRATKVAATVFALGVAATGAGGAIVGVMYPFVPGSHYQWIARLLAIIILGGMGSISGAVLAAFIFGVVETVTGDLASPSWATAAPYMIMFLVLLVRPQGLLGQRRRNDAAAAA